MTSKKRTSDPEKLLCQHLVCCRKTEPFPNTDGARHHEKRTAHSCPVTECKLCEHKSDVTGTSEFIIAKTNQLLELDRQASNIRLVEVEKSKNADQQICFSSLIRNNRKPSKVVSKAEQSRRQKEAESLLLRVFSCNTMGEALGHLFKGREKRASLIKYLETEKSTLAGLVEKHSTEPCNSY